MNKKIKLIDLLNKIANGEIEDKRTFNIIFPNNLHRSIYYDKEEQNCMQCLKNVSDDEPIYDEMDFNTEVEIIEDEIDIQNLEELTYKGEEIGLGTTEKIDNDIDDCCSVLYNCLDMCGIKINQLVKAIKQLDKKINKED